MPGKGKFSGFNWHHEFHTVDPKKEKAADCVYLTKDRICRNSKCFKNGEKCFVATRCKYRVRAENAPKPVQQEAEWQCSLPKKCIIYHDTYKVGEYISCNPQYKLIEIRFDDCAHHFKYPDAFNQGLLHGNQEVTDCVIADSQI